jgi:hypothetical protein
MQGTVEYFRTGVKVALAMFVLVIIGFTLGLMSLGVGLEVYLVIRALERITELIQRAH